jgi:cell division protein FtsN
MRLKLLCLVLPALFLAGLTLSGAAVAAPDGDIEKLEAAAAAHVAVYTALDNERSKLLLQYHALIGELTQRLKFGTAPKNPALQKLLQDAATALEALEQTADPLSTAAADLTDDAAQANALARDIRAALAEPGADTGKLRLLQDRIGAAGARLDRSLADALDARRKHEETIATARRELTELATAVDTGHLPEGGTTDQALAEMLAPPKLMNPATAAAEPAPRPADPHPSGDGSRWVIEFGLFQTEDDAGFVMARLSQTGTESHFTQTRDRLGHPAFKVVTRSFNSRAAAEAAAAEMKKHDLHPSGVVGTPAG